ncbi:MAG TPA: hypothetical protein VJT49_03355 [Amycolatopsis sp.]|uniref:hypothetical protein n=1 Tax=Amycolatopsis sp. TaxID=37632 RepID=UPI002B4A663A|nr:hypothetical protein [Amycolatopsis sp.]HKS44153.1 hypothetical protein [Amycolatopsis sp.]
MKIAPRSYWTRLRPRLRGRAVSIARHVLAVALLVLAVFLAARPGTTGPPPPQPSPHEPPSTALASGPGFSTVPIRLADAGVADLLSHGMKVDVVTVDAGEQARKVLASMATVVDVRSPPANGGRLLAGENKGPLVLISVPTELATQVAALSLRNPVAVALRDAGR